MKIILKHILRNIKEKKGRSLLIIAALLISTIVLVVDIVLPDDMYTKIEDTYKIIYGDVDVSIKGYDSIGIEDVKVNDTKFDYIGIADITKGKLNDEIAVIEGIDIAKARDLKLLGQDAVDLNENEVLVSQYFAKQKGYSEGQEIKYTYEGKDYTFVIKKVIEKKGIASLQPDYPFFITSYENVNKILQTNKYNQIFLNVEDEDKLDDFVEYLKNNNKSYDINKTIDTKGLREELESIRSLMTMVLFMTSIMIFFVIGSLNKVTLQERIPAIGTFRSVGADKRKMNSILILENAIYGLIAGVLGSLAGNALVSVVSSSFMNASGVELSSKSNEFSPMLMVIGVIFAVLLQVAITAKEIMRTNKKPIKVLIFDTQSSRYRIRKFRTAVGFVLLAISAIAYFGNTKSNMGLTLISLLALTIGIANIVPLLMRGISKVFVVFSKKIHWGFGTFVGRNIGYSKMIISSARLLVVALSLLSTIIMVSAGFSKLMLGFKETFKEYNIIASRISYPRDNYEKLTDIDGINKVDYLYYYMDTEVTYNDGKKFSTVPTFYATDIDSICVIGDHMNPKDLKDNEVMLDTKMLLKNDLKVGDTIKIKYPKLDKEFEYVIKDSCDSTYFSTSRNTIATSYQHFVKEIDEIPVQLIIKTDANVDLEQMKNTIKDNVKEVNIKVQTFDEYIDEQQKQADSIMTIFYTIIGLAVVLSFIGIVNNQVIGFMQRRKELAVLNSTCMSKKQLSRMLFLETVIANLFASAIVLVASYFSVNIIESFMQGIDMYINVKFDLLLALKFVGVVYATLLLTTISPMRKIRKFNIVQEIKYE